MHTEIHAPSRQEPVLNTPDGRSLLVTGLVLAGLGVAIGAFGAHGLEGRVPSGRIETFETGARYHQIQALGVLLLALLARTTGTATFRLAGWLLVAGITVFSGSLYLLVLTDTGVLGAITPLGGLLLIGGWFTAAVAALRRR